MSVISREESLMQEFKQNTMLRYEFLKQSRQASMLRMIVKVDKKAIETESKEGMLKSSTEIISYNDPRYFGAPPENYANVQTGNQSYGLLFTSFASDNVYADLCRFGSTKEEMKLTLFKMRAGSPDNKNLSSIQSQLTYSRVTLAKMEDYSSYNIAMFYYVQFKREDSVYKDNDKQGNLAVAINYDVGSVE